MNQTAWRDALPTVAASAVATCVAVAGMRATELGPWYRALRKPAWQPPDWVFGTVWTLVYVTSVASVAVAWPRLSDTLRVAFVVAWGTNVVLNYVWSVLFFRRHRPDLALVEVVALWCSIVAVAAVTWKVTPGGALLLLPYLIWVSIAAYLNRAIVRLNSPFLPE